MSSGTTAVIRGFLADHDARWLAEDAVLRDHTRPEACHGRSASGAWWRRLFCESFADSGADAVRVTGDGDRAAVEWRFHGRHVGSLIGETPSGRLVALPMAGIFEVVDGEIRRADLYYDALDLLRQLGVPLTAAGATGAV